MFHFLGKSYLHPSRLGLKLAIDLACAKPPDWV